MGGILEYKEISLGSIAIMDMVTASPSDASETLSDQLLACRQMKNGVECAPIVGNKKPRTWGAGLLWVWWAILDSNQ